MEGDEENCKIDYINVCSVRVETLVFSSFKGLCEVERVGVQNVQILPSFRVNGGGVHVVRGGRVRRINYWVSESRGEIGNCSKNKRALTETGT